MIGRPAWDARPTPAPPSHVARGTGNWRECPGCRWRYPGLAPVGSGSRTAEFCAGDECQDALRARLLVPVCPGCRQPIEGNKYRYPPQFEQRGRRRLWEIAAPYEVEHGHWRCAPCQGPAAREWAARQRGHGRG